MGDPKVLELEKKLDALLITINVSKWWAISILTGIIGLLGINSFYLIPKYITDYFKNDTVTQLKEELSLTVEKAKIDQETISKISNSMKLKQGVTLYICPRFYDNIKSSWASFGCAGQISSISTCENLFWTSELVTLSHDCSELVVLKNN